MKNLISIIVILFAVSCSKEMRMVEDANTMLQTELKKSNTENKKLQSENMKLEAELVVSDLKYEGLLAKFQRLEQIKTAHQDFGRSLEYRNKELQQKIKKLEEDK